VFRAWTCWRPTVTVITVDGWPLKWLYISLIIQSYTALYSILLSRPSIIKRFMVQSILTNIDVKTNFISAWLPEANNESSEVIEILLPVTFYFNPLTRLDNFKNLWRFFISLPEPCRYKAPGDKKMNLRRFQILLS